jgi:predicted GIY-YIG superfamily endonuclease
MVLCKSSLLNQEGGIISHMFSFGQNKPKPKPGMVYVAESTRKDGSKQIYTGMTRRSVWTRWREHMQGRGGKYTSSGIWFRPLGAVWSRNPRKAEKTIKSWSSSRKRAFGSFAARKYKERRGFW